MRDDNEFILVDSPIGLFDAAFEGVTERTVILGHTHMPFDRLAARRRFVNAGSVGLGYGHAGASWALLDGDVTLRRRFVRRGWGTTDSSGADRCL
jgi:hypothetical protein